MKKIFLFLSFIFAFYFANAQVKEGVGGYATISAVSLVSGTTYNFTITNFNSNVRPRGQDSYTTLDLAVGCVIWSTDCNKFVIASISDNTGITMVGTMTSIDAAQAPPTNGTKIAVFKEITTNNFTTYSLPPAADGNGVNLFGIPLGMRACIDAHYRRQDSIAFANVSGGGALPSGVKLVATTADLATLSANVGDVVHTSSFSVAGDGGGAKYLIVNSGTVNDVTGFNISGGLKAVLLKNADGSISLSQIGCKVNDGVNDNLRIQTALNAGYRYLTAYTEGYYSIKRRLVLPSNTTIRASSFTEFRADSTSTDVLFVNAGTGLDSFINVVGGVWNRNNWGSTSPNSAEPTFGATEPTLHGICFNYLTKSSFRDMKIINAPKFALNFGNSSHIAVEKVRFYTYSDGVHLNGNCHYFNIQDIEGITNDDFIAASGNDYPGYNYAVGDITNINIARVNKTGGNGNIIALFPGKVWNGSTTGRNYVFENFYIRDVKGTTTNSNGISLTSYINYPYTQGGTFRNIDIDLIAITHPSTDDAVHIECDTIYNLRIKNFQTMQPRSQINFKKAIVDVAYLENINGNGTKYRFLNINGDSTKVGKLYINNAHINQGDNTTGSAIPFINYATTHPAPKAFVHISNSNFVSTVQDQGYIHAATDSLTWQFDNVEVKGAYLALRFFNNANTAILNGLTFPNSVVGIATFGTGTTTLTPVRVGYPNAASNLFREGFDAGASRLVVDNFYTVDYIGSGGGSLPINYPQGMIYRVQNTAVVSGTWSGQNGETVNGAASYVVPANSTTEFYKATKTTWIVKNNLARLWSQAGNLGVNSATSDVFGALNNTFIDHINNGVRTMRLNANNSVSIGTTLPSPQAMLNIKSNYGTAPYTDPIYLDGLRHLSTADSAIVYQTSSAGVLKRMSIADIVANGITRQTATFNSTISSLSEDMVTFTVTGMTTSGSVAVTWRGTKDSGLLIQPAEVGTDTVKIRLYNSMGAVSTPNLTIILTVLKL